MSFQFAYRGVTGIPRIKELPAAGSKTFTKGEPVNLESGLLDNGAAADSAFVGVVNETVSTSTTEGDSVEVILGDDETIFKVDYTGSSKTSLTNGDIGTAFDLSSGDNEKIDLDDSSDGAWVVVDYDNDNDVGYVKLLGTKRADIV